MRPNLLCRARGAAHPAAAGYRVGVTGLQLTLDLLGVFVFAITGALVGVRKQLDLIGVIMLAAVTGLGGGMLRDVLIGAVPPSAVADWRHLLTTAVAGLVAFRFHPRLARIERSVTWLDALGLGLFCVTGSVKAIQYGVPPVRAALLGMLTGIGGGILRDVLAGRTPLVLREDVYAVPALAGSSVVVVTHAFGWYAWWVGIIAATVCVVLRGLAIVYRWQALRAGKID